MRDFQLPGRSPVFAANGMCATSHPLAVATALESLQGGGNAVDAAIAAAFVLGLGEPQATGIGGDMFALVKPAGDERVVALNASGRAPAGLSAEALRRDGHRAVPLHSVHAVTVPGAIDGFCALSDRFGRHGLARNLAPAIRYADEGLPVAPRAARDWRVWEHALSGAARRFYLDDGQPLTVGARFRHPAQAEVLRRIARDGRAGFYEGEAAEDMVASLRALGGSHTAEDFAATACAWGEPVAGSYKGTELLEHPPNGQGATALLMLGILSHFDLAGLPAFGARRAHIEAEAARLAYDARDRFIADPDHTARLAHMLAPETAARLAALIDPHRAMTLPIAARTEAVHRDTVYLTVVDRDRMAVSLIYSLYYPFGSGLASDRFGILFQNRGAGFTLSPGHPNEAGGGKRPLHTIIPAMTRENGRVTMSFGVMGGAYQAAGHARVLTSLVDHGLDPQEALDGPRSFPEDDGTLRLETGYPPEVRQALRQMGHDVRDAEGPMGGGQIIRIDHGAGLLVGASDPRKDGCALGY
jgi:gamma-glutamyltranspeptidase/glutathione hydrolase